MRQITGSLNVYATNRCGIRQEQLSADSGRRSCELDERVNEVIDLSVPLSVAHYDKTGGKLVGRAVKSVLFPGVGRVTQQRLEAFFDDNSNFAIYALGSLSRSDTGCRFLQQLSADGPMHRVPR